jgi:hypothetical protein
MFAAIRRASSFVSSGRTFLCLTPNTLSCDFVLAHRQIGRLFLTFKKGTTIQEAEEVEAAMNRHLGGLGIVHLAGGES